MRTAVQIVLTLAEFLVAMTITQGSSTNGEWVIKYHNDAPWDTTSDPADLDAEVRLGARILTFADGAYVHATHRQYPHACGPAPPAAEIARAAGGDRA